MGFLDYFRSVTKITPEEARTLLEKSEPGSLQVLDVRGEDEYRQGHLPGAQLFPVDQMQERLGKLDASKPTLIY